MSDPIGDFIVVNVAEAPLLNVGLGMLLAQYLEISYPMPGPTYYAFGQRPNADGTLLAFGPLTAINDYPAFGAWALGRDIVTSLGTLTVPSTAQSLSAEWFPWVDPNT